VEVAALIFFFVLEESVRSNERSMQRDQKGKPYTEHDERNEEVTVGKNSAKLFDFGHGVCGSSDWRNHKDLSGNLSTSTRAILSKPIAQCDWRSRRVL
jgi:hypothetical protein